MHSLLEALSALSLHNEDSSHVAMFMNGRQCAAKMTDKITVIGERGKGRGVVGGAGWEVSLLINAMWGLYAFHSKTASFFYYKKGIL